MHRGRSLQSLWTIALAAALSGCDCGVAARWDDDAGGLGQVDAGEPEDAGLDAGADAGPVILTCSSCHGSELNAAPPMDIDGGTSPGLRGVGAHQSHLRASGWRRTGLCSDCHLVPLTIEDPGHIDPSPAELIYNPVDGGLVVAAAGGATPTWNGDTCSNWCHGAKLHGGLLTEPKWTRFDVAQAYCGNCHGIPPPAPHPQNVGIDCSPCHSDARPGLGFSDPARHVDGVVDVSVSCTSCHGSMADDTPAPPADTTGHTSTTDRGVGAHRSHLGPSTWHHEIACTDCHQVPQAVDDPGHLDTPLPAELTWSFLATARGATASWNGATCSVYCHGETIDGGTNKTPSWTAVGVGQAACGTCHSLPPAAPHPANPNCGTCHGAVFADGGFVNPALHINGLVEANATCGSCHDLPPATGTHALHAALAPPVYGGVTTAATLPNPTGYAFGCGNCHPVDPSHHQNGTVDVELYDPTAGGLKALNPPNASYTPGATVLRDAFNVPYTLGTCANVYCHSGPTYATPGGVPAPGVDFPVGNPVYPVVYPAYTLNVARGYRAITWGGPSPGCGGCHDLPIRTTSATVTAMAGQSHSYLDAQGYESGHAFNHGLAAPLACRTCHYQTVTALNATSVDGGIASYGPVPIVGFGRHVNGRPDVVFDTVDAVTYRSTMNLSTAAYTQATSTCTNVACHQQQTAVKHGTPYRWENTTECNVCHQY